MPEPTPALLAEVLRMDPAGAEVTLRPVLEELGYGLQVALATYHRMAMWVLDHRGEAGIPDRFSADHRRGSAAAGGVTPRRRTDGLRHPGDAR